MCTRQRVTLGATAVLVLGHPHLTAGAQRVGDLRPAAPHVRPLPDSAGRPVAPLRQPPDTGAAAVRGDRRGTHALHGALVGAAVGGGAALFVAHGLHEPGGRDPLRARETWQAAAALGLAGALLGAAVGLLIP